MLLSLLLMKLRLLMVVQLMLMLVFVAMLMMLLMQVDVGDVMIVLKGQQYTMHASQGPNHTDKDVYGQMH